MLNKNCEDCPHLDKHINIEGISPLCGIALSLAHWQDSKNWCRDGFKNCPYKDLNYSETMNHYFGRRVC